MDRVTSKEIIKNLIDVGYTLSEISKYTTISRSTLSNILKNGIESNVVVTSKLENFFKANIEEVELGYFADVKNRTTSLIYTPDGFQKAIGFLDKGVLHCYSIKTEHYEIVAADEHLIQLADNSWIKANLLSIGSKLLTESGIEEIISIEDAGDINCYDVTIDHKNHRYFIDGISSHNTGKSKIAATIAANALNECDYDAIFYFDSEGGGLKEFFENCGCDTDKVFQILVSSVEDAQLQILKTYSQIEEYKKEDPDVKFLCILDSLGALVPEKLLRDANNDKVASEMRTDVLN